MWLNVSLTVNTSSAQRQLRVLKQQLSPKEIAKATARAINHSLSKSRTISRKEVKRVYNISQKNLEGINIHRANSNNLQGDLFASRKPIPLDAFAPKQEFGNVRYNITKRGKLTAKVLNRTNKNPTSGISIEVFRGNREVIPYAFLIPGGAVRVFARGEYRQGTQYGFIQRHQRVSSTGNDTPIKPLITLSTFGSIINDNVITSISKEIRVIYPNRLVHEMEYIINHVSSGGIT
jgi:hypothetical protein